MPDTVSGGWLGTYAYRGSHRHQPPVRFEAVFSGVRGDGRFGGTILDDGPLGLANVSGTQEGLIVRFTKVYVCADSAGAGPIAYAGTLSEDGRQLKGTWELPIWLPGSRRLVVRGVWDAHRLWAEEERTAEEPESERVSRTLVSAGAGWLPVERAAWSGQASGGSCPGRCGRPEDTHTPILPYPHTGPTHATRLTLYSGCSPADAGAANVVFPFRSPMTRLPFASWSGARRATW